VAAIYSVYLYFNFLSYMDVVIGVAQFFRIELPATAFARELEPCFTPVESPESNGMAEALNRPGFAGGSNS